MYVSGCVAVWVRSVTRWRTYQYQSGCWPAPGSALHDHVYSVTLMHRHTAGFSVQSQLDGWHGYWKWHSVITVIKSLSPITSDKRAVLSFCIPHSEWNIKRAHRCPSQRRNRSDCDSIALGKVSLFLHLLQSQFPPVSLRRRLDVKQVYSTSLCSWTLTYNSSSSSSCSSSCYYYYHYYHCSRCYYWY